MSRARSRTRRGHGDHSGHGEEGADERWLVSYSDMITVLMALFIVMFAISSVDQGKYDELRNALSSGFGQTDLGRLDVAEGVVVPPEMMPDPASAPPPETDTEQAALELASLEQLRDEVAAALAAHGLEGAARLTLDERGLTIGLVTSEMFFEPNRADLTTRAVQVLDAVTPAVVASGYNVSVEGHADHRTGTYPFPTNWELSSGRATQVVRHLIGTGGIGPERIAAVGFGDSRPLADGSDPDALAMNRRVDIVVLSDAPESVRQLLPELLSQES
ncbi:flagellar motor protein MotB [Occultella kanbiaonis]|uniref:flagellar motor protein MotB n=1 Tax=Occultella kanbiaonis TaxID=2675754 RepID=UPI0012B837B2|nr:flagellar motor protein MotB [Occultella kanbiaonis]